MRLDWELARRGYRRYAAYPGATYAGLFTNVFFGFLIAYILLAVYDERSIVGGYDVEDAIAYVWLAQGLLIVVGVFGPSWCELARRVQTGDVATDLQRPARRPARRASRRTSAAPCTSCSGAGCRRSCSARSCSRSRSPPTRLAGSRSRLSVVLAVVVSFGIRFLVNLTLVLAARLPRPDARSRSRSTSCFSGALIPLAFFPAPFDDAAAR